MYIAPNTTIYILKNIPLGRDYENTVYYKDAATQAAAFMAYRKYTLTDYSYQRAQLGTIRVELKYENLYDCNYLMFKNTNFENKWFYCFITGIAYINNDVTEIYYEMDVMQTWCYDYQFLDSFVERRHATHDALYTNEQPEGLEQGAYYIRSSSSSDNLEMKFKNYYCFLVTELVSGLPTGSRPDTSLIGVWGLLNGVFTGLKFLATPNYSDCNTILNAYETAGKTDAIVAIYQAPNTSISTVTPVTTNYTFTPQTETIDGYAPRNYKLFTYPYRRISVSNNQGLLEYINPTQFFNPITPSFLVEAIGFPQGQARLIMVLKSNPFYDNNMVYANFPVCAWSSNAFQSWWAQNKNSVVASLNTIGRNYDTTMAIAQNNAAIAQRSAQAQGSIAKNSADVQLANATMSNNTALDNAINSYNAQLGSLGVNAGLSVGLNLLDLNFGSAAAGAVSGLTSAQTMKASLQNATATNTTNNAIATNTAGTAIRNSQIAVSTALKNASTTLASSQLSGLTAKQNATEMLMAKKEDMQNVPNSSRGSVICDALNAAVDRQGFLAGVETITSRYATMIDAYFDMYGYAQRKMYYAYQLNERINRPHYTFLKTVGANIKGSMNAQDLQTIKGIYDNGITTWDKLENIGNYNPYSLSNEADHESGQIE